MTLCFSSNLFVLVVASFRWLVLSSEIDQLCIDEEKVLS